MPDFPISLTISLPQAIPTQFDNHIQRALSSLRGQFLDEAAYARMLGQGDITVYDVYELQRPPVEGELGLGVTILHAGKVGEEFFMTKGHFHAVLETAEAYYCLHGQGYMMMETPQGEWAAEEIHPGVVVYVPPSWAHRSINTGVEDLILFFTYPGHAGHDYGTIETKGFRKLVFEGDGKPEIVNNPRWGGGPR